MICSYLLLRRIRRYSEPGAVATGYSREPTPLATARGSERLGDDPAKHI